MRAASCWMCSQRGPAEQHEGARDAQGSLDEVDVGHKYGSESGDLQGEDLVVLDEEPGTGQKRGEHFRGGWGIFV